MTKNSPWKTVETEIRSIPLKYRNRFGSFTSVQSRKVVSWSVMIDGRVVRGFATKRAAKNAVQENVEK